MTTTELASQTGGNQWAEYEDVLNPAFFAYLPYESAATRIRAYHPQVIHGLLQTEAYAKTLNQETARRPDRDRSPETVAKQLRARMARRDILDRAASADFILHESVLWRERGRRFSVGLLDEQLQRLHDLSRQGVVIEYIPWHQPMSAAMALGSFNVLDLEGARTAGWCTWSGRTAA
jgi:hypothetical protein